MLRFILAQGKQPAGQHRFLWIPMTEAVFWTAVATAVAVIAGIIVAVVLARRRAAERSRGVSGE